MRTLPATCPPLPSAWVLLRTGDRGRETKENLYWRCQEQKMDRSSKPKHTDICIHD